VFDMLRSVGSPGGPRIGSRFVGVENRVFRRWCWRRRRRRGWSERQPGIVSVTSWPVRSVANPQRRRSQRLQTRFTLFAPHAANRSPTQGPPGEPPHGLRSDDGVAGAERLVAPRHATAGKNGSGAVRSAVAVIRQSRTAHLVSDTIVHSCADQISRRRHRQYARGRAVFPRATTWSEVPATPPSLRLRVPVSRRYRDVEDALAIPNRHRCLR